MASCTVDMNATRKDQQGSLRSSVVLTPNMPRNIMQPYHQLQDDHFQRMMFVSSSTQSGSIDPKKQSLHKKQFQDFILEKRYQLERERVRIELELRRLEINEERTRLDWEERLTATPSSLYRCCKALVLADHHLHQPNLELLNHLPLGELQSPQHPSKQLFENSSLHLSKPTLGSSTNTKEMSLSSSTSSNHFRGGHHHDNDRRSLSEKPLVCDQPKRPDISIKEIVVQIPNPCRYCGGRRRQTQEAGDENHNVFVCQDECNHDHDIDFDDTHSMTSLLTLPLLVEPWEDMASSSPSSSPHHGRPSFHHSLIKLGEEDTVDTTATNVTTTALIVEGSIEHGTRTFANNHVDEPPITSIVPFKRDDDNNNIDDNAATSPPHLPTRNDCSSEDREARPREDGHKQHLRQQATPQLALIQYNPTAKASPRRRHRLHHHHYCLRQGDGNSGDGAQCQPRKTPVKTENSIVLYHHRRVDHGDAHPGRVKKMPLMMQLPSTMVCNNSFVSTHESSCHHDDDDDEKHFSSCTMTNCFPRVLHTSDIVQAYYTGPLRQGRPYGIAVLRFDNGDMYMGEVVWGQMHGQGTYRSVSQGGQVTRGLFQHNVWIPKQYLNKQEKATM